MLCPQLGMILLLLSVADGATTKCTARTCNYEAVCVLSEGNPSCRCIGKRYFGGEFCAEQVDNCNPNPCKADAPCANALGQPICGPCANGFGGHFCDFAQAGLFTKMYMHHNRYGYFATDERFLFTVESLGDKEFQLEFYGENYAIDTFTTSPPKIGLWKMSTDLPKVAADNGLKHGHLMPYKAGYFYVAKARFWKVGVQKLQLRVSDVDSLKPYVNLAFTMQILSKRNRCLPELELNHCADPFNPLLLDIEHFVTIEPVVRKRCATDSTLQFEWTVFNSIETTLLYTYGRSTVPRLKMPPYPPWARYSGDIVQSYMIRIGVTEISANRKTYVVTRCYVFLHTKPVVAIITGGTEREMDASKAIQFDASKSRDLGMPPASQWKVTYRWSCSSQTDPDNKFCSSLSKRDKTFTIPAQTLKDGMSYNFRLMVRSRVNPQSTDYATQTLKLTASTTLVVDIDCVRNCHNRKFTPGKMLHLSALCLNCKAAAKRVYVWTVVGGVAIASNQRHLVVENADDVATVVATVRLTMGKSHGTATLKLAKNSPPAGGKCKIDPKEGTEYETDFHISCSNFKDDDQPLTYEYWSESFVLDRSTESISELRLPETRRIHVSICDALQTCSDQVIDVNVKNLDLDNIESALLAPETKLKQLLRNGDFNRAMVLARRLMSDVRTPETASLLVDHLKYAKLVTLLDIEQYVPVVSSLFATLSPLTHSRVDMISILLKVLGDGFKTCLIDKEMKELKMESFKTVAEEFGSMFLETIDTARTSIPKVQTLQREHVNTYNRLAEQYEIFSNFNAEILIQIHHWLMCSTYINRCFKYLALAASYIHEPFEPKIAIESGNLVHELFNIEQPANLTLETDGQLVVIVMSTRTALEVQRSLSTRPVLFQLLLPAENPFWWYPDEQELSTSVVYFSAYSRNLPPRRLAGVHLDHALEITFKFTENDEEAAPMLGRLQSNLDMNIFRIAVPQNALLIIRFQDTTHSLRTLLELNRRPTAYRVVQSPQIIKPGMEDMTLMIRNDADSDGDVYLAVIPGSTLKGVGETVDFSFIPELRACLSWDFRLPEPQWSTRHCKAAVRDSTDELHCYCHHMSTYAGKVFPTTAYSLYDVGDLLTELPINWFLFAFEVALGICFFCCMLKTYLSLDPNRENLVTGPKDENSNEKLDKESEIVVRINTGGNRNAATTAGVLLTFDTTEGPKKFKIFQNPQRPNLTRNSTCNVRLPINPDILNHPLTVVIKQDGGGRYPTWYCRSLEVNYVGAVRPVELKVESWIAEKVVQVSATTDHLSESEAQLSNRIHRHQNFWRLLQMHFINWFQWEPILGPWKYGNETSNRMERTLIQILKFAITVLIVFCYYGWTTFKNYEEERFIYKRLNFNLLHLFVIIGLSVAIVNLVQFAIEYWLLKASKTFPRRIPV